MSLWLLVAKGQGNCADSWDAGIHHWFLTQVLPKTNPVWQQTSQLQPIQVGYLIPVLSCISYITSRYFIQEKGTAHCAHQSHITTFVTGH
jgi:hypothetical protein